MESGYNKRDLCYLKKIVFNKTSTDLGLMQTPMIELFAKIVNDFHLLTITNGFADFFFYILLNNNK